MVCQKLTAEATKSKQTAFHYQLPNKKNTVIGTVHREGSSKHSIAVHARLTAIIALNTAQIRNRLLLFHLQQKLKMGWGGGKCKGLFYRHQQAEERKFRFLSIKSREITETQFFLFTLMNLRHILKVLILTVTQVLVHSFVLLLLHKISLRFCSKSQATTLCLCTVLSVRNKTLQTEI